MKRSVQAALLLAGALGAYQVTIAASASRVPSAAAKTMTPEERAAESYNSGLAHRDKGKKVEQEIADSKAGDAAKLQKKANDEFGKALKDFTQAAKLNPNLYQAFNGMGYSYRKLGDYATALQYYDKALEMAPGFPEATEYRGEAYLGLNRVDDAKKAYLELMGADREQAALLLTAMKSWVEKRHADAAGVDPATVAGFEKWVGERSETAKLTASMALSGRQRTW